jgi:two-component system nitrate/nitrite sensor histidine kinase NarX
MIRKRLVNLPAWKTLQRSLLLRMGGAIAAIALLAVLGMSVSGLVAESTQGSGEAINRAGSLRMQSWSMASLYLAVPLPPESAAAQRMADAIREFDATLNSPTLQAMLPRSGDSHLAETYQQTQWEWSQSVRPRFQAVADGGLPRLDDRMRAELLDDMRRFVDQINGLVKQMEDTTEAKILVMRMVLGVALILTVVVVLLTIWLIHTHLVQPLKGLLALSSSVGQGDLAARTAYTGEDELGQLGRAFNLMTEDLSKLYQDLEARVNQKTAELTRSNQLLELLYHSIARLHGAPPGKAVYLALLRDIEQLLELGHGIICLGERGGATGQAVASTMLPEDGTSGANPCVQAECLWCHGTDQTRFSIASDFHRRLTLPLADAEQQYGVLILDIPDGRQLEAWQVQLLEALSRHIGVAIGAERRIEQNRRVGLMEERAVIARELHDSLAQSLAFMKIQVSRLQSLLKRPEKQPEAEQVLLELRAGMSSAYRQLRELLSTFRLKMDGQDLAAALAQTVSEFTERGELNIELTQHLEGCPLSPNEEIHVLHVVREALSNVINHAAARRAWVNLSCRTDGMVEVAIDDDGIGIVKSADVHHYGMTIMEERARTLAGEVQYAARPDGGTRVALIFRPTSRVDANRAHRAQHAHSVQTLRRLEA